jgi:putative oxidoreductase
MNGNTTANVFTRALAGEPSGTASAWGQLILRVGVGSMIFYFHGWHKLREGLAFLNNGTPWTLAAEVAAMSFPMPVSSAVAATAVQFVCSLMLIVGLVTRLNALLLTGTLSVAILQNLLAYRDPQLAILYTLAALTMMFLGGGRYSVDARLFSRGTGAKSETGPETSG